MEELDPAAQQDEKGSASAPPPRQASAIDGRLPPAVLATLASRNDLDPEVPWEEGESDEDQASHPGPSPAED